MALKLYFHPFASFCQKVLIALYENGTSFEPVLIDLGNPALLDRLMERPSFVRVLEEARLFLQFFPMRGRTIASSD